MAMQRRSPPPEAPKSRLSDEVDESLARRKAAKAKASLAKPPTGNLISTGSTLLDLAISGNAYEGFDGGLPGGILVEIFGPSGAGKTVMLCEIAGAIQRQGGEVKFNDPEARLNRQFGSMFGYDVGAGGPAIPDTVTEVFSSIRDWEPKDQKIVNGVMADSLAALSTDLEMSKEEGDKMGMRRAKEFSEECRKTCRIITQRNLLVVCSNQVRHNLDAGPYGEKYKTPGGDAVGFYSSLRLRCLKPEKIKKKLTFGRREESRVVGVETTIEVYKSSVWEPWHTADVRIIFDYGIDDVSANLDYLKRHYGTTTYNVGDDRMGASLEAAARRVEEAGMEKVLRDEVVRVWREVEGKFKDGQRTRRRD